MICHKIYINIFAGQRKNGRMPDPSQPSTGAFMTKYEIIISDIRKKIQDGTYVVNEKLPTEAELGQRYGVSRITIKKAIDQLVLEGLVIKRRGAGTFVKGISEQEGKFQLQMNGLFSTIDKSKIRSEVLRFEVVPAGEMVAEKLKIDPEDFVYYCVRFRDDGEHWKVIDYVYMPIDLIQGLKKDVLYRSLYNYIENTLGLRIQSAHRVIRAVRPNEDDKTYLGVKDGDPILSIEQVGYLDSGIPFEFSDQHHIGDEFEFKTVSIR